MKKKTSKKGIRGGIAVKAWNMAKNGRSCKEIADEIGFTTTAVKLYLRAKYKMEATKLWADKIKAIGVCEVSGKTRDQCTLNAHHILEKSVWTHLRFDLDNGICLSEDNHTMNVLLSPHNNMVSAANFIEWMKINKPEKYQYYLDHKDDKRGHEIDYEEEYKRLLNDSL